MKIQTVIEFINDGSKMDKEINNQVGLQYRDGAFYPYNLIMAEECSKKYKNGDFVIFLDCNLEHSQKVTWQQHKSIFLYLGQMASILYGGGIDMYTVFDRMQRKSGFRVSVTTERLYRDVWKPMQEALFKTKSIKHLKKDQVNTIYLHVDDFFNREFEKSKPFPDYYEQSFNKKNT